MIFLREVKWYKAKKWGVFLGLSLLLLVKVVDAAEIVEQIAAVVNDEIIFLSDIKRHQAFFLLSKKTQSNTPPLKEALEELINIRLLATESQRFGSTPPDDKEVDKAVEKIRKQFSSEAEFQESLKGYATTLEAFRQEVRERIEVERYVDERIRFFIFVTPDEIDRHYEENRDRYGEKNLEAVRKIIEKEIVEEQTQLRLKDYVNRLRSRATIQINL